MRSERTLRTERPNRQFYRMPPRPCPYLVGRIEQNIFTELSGPDSQHHYDLLSQSGFRRSHSIAYRPACPGCTACVPVRTVVREFVPSRSMRRVLAANMDLTASEAIPFATPEQFYVFIRYLRARHGDGEMALMQYDDYRGMIEDTALNTVLTEFRTGDGSLIGGCLVDRLGDGLSAVYSFFEPEERRRGLGTYIVLWLIERARQLGLPYVYLGYWIAESRKMSYKSRFQPLEGFGRGGWQPVRE
ncbi:MAG: arginyltransferase [Alphaproteobacteria bacterium]|nr:arginyltransferase [Alphaproteobacteria bacterium]